MFNEGTLEERGLIGWRGQNLMDKEAHHDGKSTYDLITLWNDLYT